MTALTLADFLRARLDEDDSVAREASYPHPKWIVRKPWNDPRDPNRPQVSTEMVYRPDGSGTSTGIALTPPHQVYDGHKIVPHIARHDPARVLADVEAKRRIVDLHDRAHECSGLDHTGDIDNCRWYMQGEWCTTLRLTGLPFADHPDYRDEWRP